MSEGNGNKVEWTTEQVVSTVTLLVKKRHGLDYDAYVSKLKNNDESIDYCRDSDIIGLLKLIGVGSEVLVA